MRFARNLLLCFAALLGACAPARAQFIGYISPQTVSQTVWTNANCTGELISPVFQNVGQSVNVLSFNITSSDLGILIWIEGSSDGTNYYAISNDALEISGSIVGFGSYPYLRAHLLPGGTTGTCTVNATYSGTSVAPSVLLGQQDTTDYVKNLFNFRALNANAAVSNFQTPYGNAAGMLTFRSSANPPAGSTIAVSAQSSGGLFFNLGTFALRANTNLQSFWVPAFPTSVLQFTYTSGGAGSGTFSANFVFVKPGFTQSPFGENTAVVNLSAAGPTQIIAAPTAGSIRIVSVNLSSGTAEAIDLQQGTGSNCATGNSQLTGLTHLAANAPWIQPFPGAGVVALPGNAVCLHLSGANQTDGTITYSVY